MLPVVLASGSPRRQELLRGLVAEFEVVVSEVDEEALTVADPWETAERLALAKARAVALIRPGALVIGGDTVVAVLGLDASDRTLTPNPLSREDHTGEGALEQLTKPRDVADARRMLRRLSGREHVVITGVALVGPGIERGFSDTTRVAFRELGDDEIAAYVATGEPMDKAGGYAIQGGAAGFVARTEGSISNVVGLPLEKLAEAFTALSA